MPMMILIRDGHSTKWGWYTFTSEQFINPQVSLRLKYYLINSIIFADPTASSYFKKSWVKNLQRIKKKKENKISRRNRNKILPLIILPIAVFLFIVAKRSSHEVEGSNPFGSANNYSRLLHFPIFLN